MKEYLSHNPDVYCNAHVFGIFFAMHLYDNIMFSHKSYNTLDERKIRFIM